MRKYLSVVVLLISFSSALSQKISGIVIDENTREPLIGVNVILSNTNGTTTNIDGKFSLELKENERTITFKYIGYERIVKNIDGKSEFNIRMKSANQQIGTVVISAGKFEQKIEEITVSMEVISPSLIENKNTTNIQTAMEQVPGVNITDGQANIRGGSGWSYGAGSRVLVMVDDMPLISGDAGQVQWKLIATENINQVEVIKGASSALYGSSALNGVINIRTAFPKLSEIEKNPSVGYTKITTHFGITDHAKRDVLKDQKTAIIRIEQLYPFPNRNLESLIKKYKNVNKYIWVQEEPKNMGPWVHIREHFRYVQLKIELISREESASPASGSYKRYNERQETIINRVFNI